MALTSVWRSLLVLGVVILLAIPSAIYSCGPFFEPTIFAFEDQPEAPPEDFAAGKLGIVRPGFRRPYLVVAYRYMAGLKFTADEQKTVLEVWRGDVGSQHPTADEALAAWNVARDKVPGLPAAPPISLEAAVSPEQPYQKFLNCPGEALLTAARTLENRIAQYRAEPTVRDWVAAQDQVFRNCGGEVRMIPAALAAGEPLPRADRSYQIAAAEFYARSYEDAVAAFDAIAQDRASPWAEISPYLAARALVRKGVLVHSQNESFDRAALVAAQRRLQKIVDDPHTAPMHDPAVRLLNFVRFRTEPEKRVAEIDRMILSPNPDTNLRQDLWDYLLLLSRGEQGEDPSDWVKTFYAPRSTFSAEVKDPSRIEHAIAKWREEKTLPWLVAALSLAAPQHAAVADLLAAAEKTAPSSPGYLTVRHQALRLMIDRGEAEAARGELDRLLNKPDISLGSRNLFQEERQRVATGLDDFLRFAAEAPVPAELDQDTMEEVPSNPGAAKSEPVYFNRYPAQVFARRLPLSVLVEAASSPVLPGNLRRELARSTWARAVLVGDLEAARKLQPVLQALDTPLWKTMEPFRKATTADGKRFAALFVILENPGFKPSVREGALRKPTLGEIDSYRDNWWCADMGTNGGNNWGQSYAGYNPDSNLKYAERESEFPFPAWLSEKEKAATKEDFRKLLAIGTAPNYLTSQVIDYARAHPDDPRVPPALHLAVRSTRYGCTNIETSRLSKAAFDFLHEHYPGSEWAAKTKYYY